MAFLFSATKTGFNTQPRGGGCFESICIKQAIFEFQHTAARRRLLRPLVERLERSRVSTHSRAEAAALSMLDRQSTQAFQHTAARRRLLST